MRFDFSLVSYQSSDNQNGVSQSSVCDPSKMPSVQVHCMNIMDGNISNPINKLDEYAGNSNAKINIIIIHNVESIAVKELRRLNFLFRVTDKSYIYANVVILLLWNTQSRPFTDEERRLYGVVDDVETEPNEVGSSISLRSFLAAEWSKSGPDVSGRALSGRITRSAFSAKEDLNPIAMDLSCSVIRDNVAEQKRANEKWCTMPNRMMRWREEMMRWTPEMMRWTQEMMERFQSLLETENGFFPLLIIFPLLILILCYYLSEKSNTDEGAVNRTSNEEVDAIAASTQNLRAVL